MAKPDITMDMPIREQIKELTLFISDREFAIMQHIYQPFKGANVSLNVAINMLPEEKLPAILTQVRNTALLNIHEAA